MDSLLESPTLELDEIGLPSLLPRRRRGLSETTPNQRSLIKSLASGAISGLAAVGNLIDVPWSMGRDVLAGENPLDQLLSPFSAENRTSGRQLLEKAGILGANKPGFDWGDVAGGIVDIADPFLLPLSFGAKALSRAGQAAKAAGLMDDAPRIVARTLKRAHVGKREARLLGTPKMLIDAADDPAKALAKFTEAASKKGRNAADLLDKPLGGLVGWGKPFVAPSTVLGKAGGTAEKVAKTLDWAGEGIRFGKYSPVRVAANLFDRAGFQTKTKAGYDALSSLFNRQEAAIAGSKGFGNKFQNLVMDAGLDADDRADDLARLLEGVTPPAGPTEQAVFDEWRKVADAMQPEARSWGLKGKEAADPANILYMVRKLSKRQRMPDGTWKVFPTADPSNISRKDLWRGWEGGTADIRKAARLVAPLVEQGKSVKDVENAIAAMMAVGGIRPIRPITKTLGTKTKTVNSVKQIAKAMHEMDPDVLNAGIFGNYGLFDIEGRVQSHLSKLATAKEVINTLTMPGVLKTSAAPRAETTSVQHVLRKLGMGFGKDQGIGGEGAYIRLGEALGLPSATITPGVVSSLRKMRIDRPLARDILKMADTFTKAPAAVAEPLMWYDSALNVWKAFQTGPWPAFQVRNLSSGQAQEALRGAFSGKWWKAVNNLVRGENPAVFKEHPLVRDLATDWGLNATALTDQQAGDLARAVLRQYGVVTKYQGEALQRIGPTANAGGRTAADFAAEYVGGGLRGKGKGLSIGQILKQYAGRYPGTRLNPLRSTIRGVGAAGESTFGPVVAGETAGHWVEALNRAPGFLKETAAGVDPLEAARRVGASQVRYENRYYTPFEQGMLRLFPFGKFLRGQAEYVARELATRPAGAMGTAVRATGRSGDDSIKPEYVQQTASIPLPPGPSGDARYMTSFGMMHEDPISFLGGGARGLLQELGSRMTPAVKAPMEWALGRSFFQRGPEGGRELTEMDPTIGRTLRNVEQLITGDRSRQEAVKLPLWMEQTAANTPFSRLLTTARTLTDPRKAISSRVPIPGPAAAANLLTGIRVVDVPEAAQEAILREGITKRLRESGVAKVFERTYVPKEVLEELAPEAQMEAMTAQELLNILAQRSKKRAKGEPLGPIGGVTTGAPGQRGW